MENFLLQRELTISCSRTERGKHMQLGIRLHDIKKAPLEERLAIAKEQGFLCGHLALSKVITEYPVDDGALTPGYAMYLKKIFAKNDLDIAVLGCYLNLANPDEGQLAKITHRYLAHIRFASLLGVGVVGTETGAVNEAYKFEEKNHSDEALDIFIQNVKPVISYAEKMGVFLQSGRCGNISYAIRRERGKCLMRSRLQIFRSFLIRSIFWISAIIRTGM